MEVIIKPDQKWQLLNIKEIWRFRELFYIFVWRDIKVRYKQTVLGILWVVLQPLITMLIFSHIFGRLAKIPSDNLPYELFVFTGLLFWTFFSTALTSASNSMVDNAHIIKKVYFPREILPLATILTSLVDFSINFILLLIISLFFGRLPSPLMLVLLPLTVMITSVTAAGIGLFLASFNVKYRDVRYILPFFIQILIFLTPVIYPVSAVRDSFRGFILLNPLTSVIESMRSVIGGSSYINTTNLLISATSALIIFIIGLTYFKITERFFADIA